ncbi:hypothetical protein [uncultured Desulfovibrio sp.]|uniref:hypothetical protein n=1 Tax=uncultured Desulfovibrio sp. TaxID=167968 RepID=UPI002634EEC1|nr:hypothetical protein [uncultured Desulfovibrio sp.]
MDALHTRIDEVVVTQLKDQGKRMRDLESEVRDLREDRARNEGKKAGSKAVWVGLIAIVSAASSAISAVITKMF